MVCCAVISVFSVKFKFQLSLAISYTDMLLVLITYCNNLQHLFEVIDPPLSYQNGIPAMFYKMNGIFSFSLLTYV